MSYEIEKSIPIEPKAKLGEHMWPLLKMEPGDSFLVPIRDYSPTRVHQIMATVRLRNAGWSWTARLMKPERGVRIWCIQKPDVANNQGRTADTNLNQTP